MTSRSTLGLCQEDDTVCILCTRGCWQPYSMSVVDDMLSGPKPLRSKGDSNRQVNFPSDLFINVHEPEAGVLKVWDCSGFLIAQLFIPNCATFHPEGIVAEKLSNEMDTQNVMSTPKF